MLFQQEKVFQERLKASHNIITMLDNKVGELTKMGYDQLPDLLNKIRQMTAGEECAARCLVTKCAANDTSRLMVISSAP